MTLGVIALSFAKRSEYEEPNPVNVKLARAAEKIVRGLPAKPIVVAQQEIATQLEWDRQPADLVITHEHATVKGNGKKYLDSADFLREAFKLFREKGVTHVIVVANPFLHLSAVRKMVAAEGFKVLIYEVPKVGFDPSDRNLQWWCKGPIRFVVYLGLQVLGKLIGRDFHGIGERQSA